MLTIYYYIIYTQEAQETIEFVISVKKSNNKITSHILCLYFLHQIMASSINNNVNKYQYQLAVLVSILVSIK